MIDKLQKIVNETTKARVMVSLERDKEDIDLQLYKIEQSLFVIMDAVKNNVALADVRLSLPSDELLDKAEMQINHLPSDIGIKKLKLLVIGIIMKVRIAKRQ